MTLPVGLQLYTIRDETEKDFEGSLEKVAEIGYKGVEFAGFGGIPSGKMKNLLDRVGLKAVGSHTAIELLREKPDEVIEYNIEIGNRFVVCPWANPTTVEEYDELAAFFNRIGEKCRNKDLGFAYHNHAHEFSKLGGVYGLDYLYANTDPNLVKAELDTFWIEYAGLSAARYLGKFNKRCPLVHLKDMDSRESRNFSEVGSGVIDIKAIAGAAADIGAEWLIVEQDTCSKPSMESVRISFENLKKLKLI